MTLVLDGQSTPLALGSEVMRKQVDTTDPIRWMRSTDSMDGLTSFFICERPLARVSLGGVKL